MVKDDDVISGWKWKLELAWLSKALKPALQLYKWASTSGSNEKQVIPPSTHLLAEVFTKLQLSKIGIQDWSFSDLTVGLYLIYLSQASAGKVEEINGVQITSDVVLLIVFYHQAESLEGTIEIVNNNRSGNGAFIFTTSGVAARKFQSEIGADQVGINMPIPVPLPFFLFTGSKASFAGDLNFYGTVHVVVCKVGLIIGKGGGTIKTLQTKSQACIQVQELKETMKGSGMPWPGDEGEQRWEQAWTTIKKGIQVVPAELPER